MQCTQSGVVNSFVYISVYLPVCVTSGRGHINLGSLSARDGLKVEAGCGLAPIRLSSLRCFSRNE